MYSDKRKLFNLFKSNLIYMAVFLFMVPSTRAATSDFTAAPPFLVGEAGKPNVMIALDISGSMKAVAYRDVGAGNWKNGLHDDFDPAINYFGYFETNKKYLYDDSADAGFFVEDAMGNWDGNFLNWLAMRRIDVVRKVLVGGKVRDRNGESIGGSTWYVVEGQNEPSDYTFRKSYSNSSTVSPFDNNAEILISNGEISEVDSGGALRIPLSSEFEVGVVTTDYDVDEDNWVSVTYENTYPVTPAVVATGLSYNGGDPTHARIRNVTTTGFEVRLEEWEYRDGNHTTEDITYLVAAQGTHTITVEGNPVTIIAGSTTTNTTGSGVSDTVVFGGAFSTTPILFSSVSTYNDSEPVITRNYDITTTSFKVTMQEEENNDDVHATERIDWIAIEPAVGDVDSMGVSIEANSTGAVVDQSWYTQTFDPAAGFTAAPIIAANLQTLNGSDPAAVRYGNGGVTETQVKFKAEEEKSQDNEVSHNDEDVGFLAVSIPGTYKIRIGHQTEPTGIIQNNTGSLRFGVAVYNYDHNKSPTSIYNGNKVHGGTMRPCYPDMNLPVSARTNFDICLDTHVKSPINNIIDVIEDHPLIWGTTPIAETLYDIKGYFEQKDHARNGHTQWYDNGTEGTAGARNSYEISDAWDPYYYDEYGAKAPCAKSFVLHFNDGAPYRDFDGDASDHPTLTSDGVGTMGENEALDELALELRSDDCRTDSGMSGHQGIISYYVYAALGENEANNTSTKRMREAAANGGFVDDKDDDTPNQPDPSHPSNFITYVSTGGCTANEWDEDADCNPDTFYFANDGAALVTELEAVFKSITLRAASGGASSVIAASRSGEGAVFNAVFQTSAEEGSEAVKWVGDIHALMIDDEGNLRADDGDKTLELGSIDGYIDMCTEENDETRIVRVKVTKNDDGTGRPTDAQKAACSESVFSLGLFDLDSEYIWSASSWLEALSDTEATTQRSYTSTGNGRYIITGIDADADGLIKTAETKAFTPANFPAELAGLLNASDASEASNIVEFIRGKDISGMRSRQLGGVTKRLGDIIYSTPTAVGRPAENLDLLYGSATYLEFFDKYRHRRQVIYSGSNDGMLHAFNGGWYDPDNKIFKKAKGGGAPGSDKEYDLGAELWSYVPYNLLPHLEYLTDPDYGSVISDHAYYVDLKPRIFDARIFPDDAIHPKGWGTILVGGMRLGGGEITVNADTTGGNDNRTMRSAIFILDITDPDSPPTVLLEYTHADLGFTTAIPSPVVHGATDNEGTNGTWYLMLGSGADTNAAGFNDVKSTQAGRLFLLNLNNIANNSGSILETDFGTSGILTLSESNSFISDLVPVDYGLDKMTTDAVYFGTVAGDSTAGWTGNLYRIKIQDATNATQEAVTDWAATMVYAAGKPITAAPAIGFDSVRNRWLYVGSGRFYTVVDNTDTTAYQYYGIKEPRNTSGSFSWGTASGLVNVTNTKVDVDTEKLTNAPALTPSLPTDPTLLDLERRMLNYTNSSEYEGGWLRNFSAGERNFGLGTLLGGTLTYTSYNPDNDECSINGQAYLYVVNALTGTAGRGPIIGDSSGDHYQYTVDLGSSPATTPSLHTGLGYTDKGSTKAIIQKADGSILTQDQSNQKAIRSGEASWRLME